MKTEIEKLLSRIEEEKSNGLISINITIANIFNLTLESFAAEINEMLDAESVPLRETLH